MIHIPNITVLDERSNMDVLKVLWLNLLESLKSNRGTLSLGPGEKDTETETEKETETETQEETEEVTETAEDTETEETEEEKAAKKDERTSRHTEFKSKAQQLDRLVELGVLSQDSNGEIHLNQEVLKSKKVDAKDIVTLESLRFTKDEVHADSWPIVEKFNKAIDHFGKEMSVRDFHVQSLYAENAILREWPEFLQKDSPLRKKAMEILKSDPEFKTTYKGNPLKNFFAVKRAAEALANKTSKPKPKKKPSFIVGKGDTGGADKGGKGKSIEDMTATELDALEKKEHDRLFKTKKGKI